LPGIGLLGLTLIVNHSSLAQQYSVPIVTNAAARVFIVADPNATEAFQARPGPVTNLFDKGLLALTGKSDLTSAWAQLVSTQDIIGIKIYCKPGANSGTRPAVVAAAVKSLQAAGIASDHIIIWDRDEVELRMAGYYTLGKELGVRVAAAAKGGWDTNNVYDSPIIGTLVYGDLEFGSKEESAGRKSYVSQLVSQQFTKLISITPLLNHNEAGVCGNLFSLAMGSTDNIIRFEGDAGRLSTAVPELYALPVLGDRVVLNVTDALICQYEGGDRGLLHYSTMLNQLRFSRDPVALDVLSLQELDTQRRKAKAPSVRPNLELYRNAELVEIGIADPARIKVEQIR